MRIRIYNINGEVKVNKVGDGVEEKLANNIKDGEMVEITISVNQSINTERTLINKKPDDRKTKVIYEV